MQSVTVPSICMNSNHDKKRNCQIAFELMSEAVTAGAEWIVLPELFSYHGPYKDLYANGESLDSQLFEQLSLFAQTNKIVLFGGSVPFIDQASESDDGSIRKVHNAMPVFGRDGQLISLYKKCHLFELKDSDGKSTYSESEGFLAGNQPMTLEIDGFHIGLSICYDLRFSLFYQRLAVDKPLDVILVPAAFTLKTGMAHWELFLRARAVEFQSYVLAANQYGSHGNGKESFGHSMIIDPWGIVQGNTGAKKGIAWSTVDKEHIHQVRQILPVMTNARPEIY